MGTFASATSLARTFTPIVGADVVLDAGSRASLPVESTFEHGVLALSDGLTVDGTDVPRGNLLVVEPGRVELTLQTPGEGRALLIGGEPFEEELVMWWNFVGRTHEEIVQARADWQAGRGFGTVHGYAGDRLPAPELPTARLRSRRRHRRA